MIYQISDKLLYNLIEIEKIVFQINKTDIPTKTLVELKQSSIIDELFYFAKKLNIPLTFGEAKQITVGKILDDSNNKGLKLIHNYRSLLDFMKQNEQEMRMSLITHINKLLSNGILDMWEYGMLRNASEQYKNEFDFFDPVGKINPEPYIGEKTIKIVNATKILKHLTLKKPFIGLNDATAIVTFSNEMIRLLDENQFLFSPIKMLDEIDLNEILSKDFEIVLENISNAAYSTFKQILLRIERENYDDSIRTKSKFLNLNERQLAALRYLEHNLKISRRQYMKLFTVSTMTAFRDMNQLVEQKIVSVEGKGRGTYYKFER